MIEEKVIVTENVRFNDDGSSDHIMVLDDHLLSVEHFPVSPFVRVDTDIAWFIQCSPITANGAKRLKERKS